MRYTLALLVALAACIEPPDAPPDTRVRAVPARAVLEELGVRYTGGGTVTTLDSELADVDFDFGTVRVTLGSTAPDLIVWEDAIDRVTVYRACPFVCDGLRLTITE